MALSERTEGIPFGIRFLGFAMDFYTQDLDEME